METLPLNKKNRLKIASAFKAHNRVDVTIDAVIEGQMGSVLVDDPEQPGLFVINTFPFLFIAGDVHSPAGQTYLKELPVYALIMSSSPGWVEEGQALYGDRWRDMPRYSTKSESISIPALTEIIRQSAIKDQIKPIDFELAKKLYAQEDFFVDLSNYESPSDFIDRGLGYVLLDGDQVVGAAYAALVCSKGIEVSIYVEEKYRRKGAAITMAANLLRDSLERGLDPHWDAANPESLALALKLGYKFAGEYSAYYINAEQ